MQFQAALGLAGTSGFTSTGGSNPYQAVQFNQTDGGGRRPGYDHDTPIGPQLPPKPNTPGTFKPEPDHPRVGGSLRLLPDGSVTFLNENINPQVNERITAVPEIDRELIKPYMANNETSSNFSGQLPSEGTLDVIQLSLDGIGMIPGLGEPVDMFNGLISLVRGNYIDATLSFASMIPFIGNVSGGTKIGKRVFNMADDGANIAGGAAKFTRETFETAADAVGSTSVNGVKILDKVKTKNPVYISEGFTEVHYVIDADGVQYTVPFNTSTKRYLDGHESSGW